MSLAGCEGDILKFVIGPTLGFVFGVALIWIKEWIVARTQKRNKQKALCTAIEVEQRAIMDEWDRVRAARAAVLEGHGTTFHAASHRVVATLSEALIELDPGRSRQYIGLAVSCEVLEDSARALAKELDRFVVLSKEEQGPARGLVVAELNALAGNLQRVTVARRDVIRKLPNRQPNPALLPELEKNAKLLSQIVDQWAEDYRKQTGVTRDF